MSVVLTSMVQQCYGELILGFVTSSTIYRPVHTYSATAGVGPFEPGLYIDLINSNPGWSFEFAGLAIQEFPDILGTYGRQIQLQSDNDSTTYLFPGEIGAISPAPQFVATNTSADVAVVHQVMSLQIDYEFSSVDIPVNSNDCTLWGNVGYTLEICVLNYETNVIAARTTTLLAC